ncbi:MAG: 50S ribosomal protein L21 [Candidatus Uhrbacteria bacterium]|nr:50S ribosomal protein L21 [Candidatus Uhrbacteria bacterium]
MATLAVIQTGGKQYLVREGQELKIEKLNSEVGANVDFDVLLVSDEEGTTTHVGTPTLSGAKVTAVILDQGRADKVSVIKYKSKVRYRRNVGHRQPFTKIKIEKIAAS